MVRVVDASPDDNLADRIQVWDGALLQRKWTDPATEYMG
jgi:hypothetical protein